jgi:hypothetical protein
MMRALFENEMVQLRCPPMLKVLEMQKAAKMLVALWALLLTPAMVLADVGIGRVDTISPAVSERYSALPAAADPAGAIFSPTLAESTIVWFAGRQWVVIGWDGEGVAPSANTATLFLAKDSPDRPADSTFHNPANAADRSNQYTGSDLRIAIDDFYTNDLTDPREKSSIVPRNLEGDSANFSYTGGATNTDTFATAAGNTTASQYVTGYYLDSADTMDWYAYHELRVNGTIGSAPYNGTYHPDKVAGAAVNGPVLWPLSVSEAGLLDGSIREYNYWWWLRSPGYDVT